MNEYPWPNLPILAIPERFKIIGGPLARPMFMGVHLVDGKGRTIGVLNDIVTGERIAAALNLVYLMKKYDIPYHIIERYNDGFIECPEEEWIKIKKIMMEL